MLLNSGASLDGVMLAGAKREKRGETSKKKNARIDDVANVANWPRWFNRTLSRLIVPSTKRRYFQTRQRRGEPRNSGRTSTITYWERPGLKKRIRVVETATTPLKRRDGSASKDRGKHQGETGFPRRTRLLKS